MAYLEGANAMGKPPIPPPDLPTMSGMLGDGSEGPAGPSKTAGVTRLFFEVEKTIDMIAEAVPALSARLDKVKTDLRDILTTISISAGAPGRGSANGELESPTSY